MIYLTTETDDFLTAENNDYIILEVGAILPKKETLEEDTFNYFDCWTTDKYERR